MPDRNGNLTPQEIIDQSISPLLKTRELKMNDEDVQRRVRLFEQQLASGDLEHKLNLLKFDVTRGIAELLSQAKPGPNGETPALTPHGQKILQLLGFGSGPTPYDYLQDPSLQSGAAATEKGLIPSAGETLGARTTMRGQDLTAQAADAANKLGHDQLRMQAMDNFINAGANPYLLSQGDPLDPATVARAFGDVTPTARINAFANLISSYASHLKAASDDALAKLQAAQYTADAKNKYAPLKILSDTLGRYNVALAQAANAGVGDDEKSKLLASTNYVASALAQELNKLGYPLPPAAQPEVGWWDKMKNFFTGGGASKGIDLSKIPLNPDGTPNLDADISTMTNGASPAPGAPRPPSAATTPTTPPPPAAGAPNSSPRSALPLLDNRGRPVPYMSPEQTALAFAQAQQNKVSRAAGKAEAPVGAPAPTIQLQRPAAPPNFPLLPGASPADQVVLQAIDRYISESYRTPEAALMLRFPPDVKLRLFREAVMGGPKPPVPQDVLSTAYGPPVL